MERKYKEEEDDEEEEGTGRRRTLDFTQRVLLIQSGTTVSGTARAQSDYLSTSSVVKQPTQLTSVWSRRGGKLGIPLMQKGEDADIGTPGSQNL